MSALLESLRQVLGNRQVRRAELSWLLGVAAQWAWVVAILVWAYDVGGVAGAGLAGLLRMLPAAFLAPFLTTLTDRLAPGRVLLGIHVMGAATVGFASLAIAVGLPPPVVFGAVVVEGTLATILRPTTMALLPALVRSPQELVASNSISSLNEGLGVLIGPAIGGVLLTLGGPALVALVTAAAFVLGALAVLIIDTRRPVRAGRETVGAALRDVFGGFAALRAFPAAGLLIGLFAFQTFVRGALSVLLVAASVELLGLGDAGVGYLTSAIGAGGLVGAFAALALVTRRRLGTPFSISLAFWGAPLALLGLVPLTPVAFAALLVVGLANATLDVAGFTLLQRCVTTRVRGRVFGALEAVAALTIGLGSIVAPLLVDVLGIAGALVAIGVLLPAAAVASAGIVRRFDEAVVVPHRQLELIRGVPMFAPLSMTALEQIAQALSPERHDAGARIIEQGAIGDAWYLVAAGRVEIVHDEKRVATLSVGAGFGEIALLSDRPRTADVVATEPVELYRLHRDEFLEALTGNPHSRLAADDLAAARLAELGHGEPEAG